MCSALSEISKNLQKLGMSHWPSANDNDTSGCQLEGMALHISFTNFFGFNSTDLGLGLFMFVHFIFEYHLNSLLKR